jgi:hypothetical protein
MNYKFVLFINLQQIQIDLENMVKGVWKIVFKFLNI